MSKRKPAILPHATPASLPPWLGRLDRLRSMFWPIVVVLFVALVLLEAGIGWAPAVLQLLTSGLLLTAWLLAGYGWGAMARSLARIDHRSPLIRITTLAAGLGIMSLLVLGLGLVGWMKQPVAIVMLVAGAGFTLYRIIRQRAAISHRVDFVHFWWLLLLPLASLTFTAAMLPAGVLWGGDEPNGYDVVEYHLQVPREWFEAGQIVPLHHNVFSYFPFNVEMHYLLAMHTMGSPWSAQFLAQMMHAAFIGLTVAAVYAAVCERGRARAIMAALFVASTPWMPMLGAIAYNEGGLLLYGTLAIAWAMKVLNARTALADLPAEDRSAKADPTRAALAIAGVMAGFACGCKLTAVPILLIGLPLAIAVVARKHFASLAMFVLIGLLVFSPWLIRNYAWARNPVFPEQQNLLGRAHFSPLQSDRFYKAHKARPDQQSTTARIKELGHQVFADWRFGYALVPLGVVALLVTFRRHESQFLLLMLAGLTGFWLFATHLQGRFYVLAIPIAAIALTQLLRWRALPWLMGISVIAVVVGNVEVQSNLLGIGRSNGIDVMETVGWEKLDKAREFEERLPTPSTPIVLVGDAAVFWYQVPMSRLHYRTVFDVDTGVNGSAIEAWSAGLPPGQQVYLVIAHDELDRLSRSYGTPPMADRGAKGIPFTIQPASTSPAAPRLLSPPAPASAPSR